MNTKIQTPTFREAQKQITLIFTVSIRERTLSKIVPLPRALSSLQRSERLLIRGAWKHPVGPGIEATISVRRGGTEDVRQTRRTARWDESLTPVLKNILEKGAP